MVDGLTHAPLAQALTQMAPKANKRRSARMLSTLKGMYARIKRGSNLRCTPTDGFKCWLLQVLRRCAEVVNHPQVLFELGLRM